MLHCASENAIFSQEPNQPVGIRRFDSFRHRLAIWTRAAVEKRVEATSRGIKISKLRHCDSAYIIDSVISTKMQLRDPALLEIIVQTAASIDACCLRSPSFAADACRRGRPFRLRRCSDPVNRRNSSKTTTSDETSRRSSGNNVTAVACRRYPLTNVRFALDVSYNQRISAKSSQSIHVQAMSYGQFWKSVGPLPSADGPISFLRLTDRSAIFFFCFCS